MSVFEEGVHVRPIDFRAKKDVIIAAMQYRAQPANLPVNDIRPPGLDVFQNLDRHPIALSTEALDLGDRCLLAQTT